MIKSIFAEFSLDKLFPIIDAPKKQNMITKYNYSSKGKVAKILTLQKEVSLSNPKTESFDRKVGILSNQAMLCHGRAERC